MLNELHHKKPNNWLSSEFQTRLPRIIAKFTEEDIENVGFTLQQQCQKWWKLHLTPIQDGPRKLAQFIARL